PQKIDSFSPVVIQAGGAPTTRTDPRSPEESAQAAAEPGARVFVIFLDVMHVDYAASQTIAKPLIDALRRLIGPDDLVAIVNPLTPVRAITFTRRVAAIEGTLSRPWGARDRLLSDPVEQRFAACYPGLPRIPGETVAPDLGIAQEMILRRREAQTFDALDALVTELREIREERRAVITITHGWRVYRPNQALVRPIGPAASPIPRPGFDPRTGQLSMPAAAGGVACEGDRMRLAQLDHTMRFRQLLDRANRANVSFYPVDPRGVVPFDDDIVPVAGVGQNPMIPVVEDNNRLGERNTSIRTMAEYTDGVAVVSTNNFAPALQRITNDLSAYYLLGYYSTGKFDGKFHSITVSVTRPGVQIRARRGYLASVESAVPPSDTTLSASATAEAQAVTLALSSLGSIAREPAMFLQAGVAWPSSNVPAVWAVVEIGRGSAASDFARGGDADVLLVDPAGSTAGSGRATFSPGGRIVRLTIAPRELPPGSYELRVRVKGAAAQSAVNESLRVTVPASADESGALLFRRGSTTGGREEPTADPRFRRGDTLRVAVPAGRSAAPGSARLLDRTGKPLAIPVTPSAVDEPDGSRWLTAQAALAPLAPGDYVIEVTASIAGTQRRTLTVFRVIP
ncbi:MAG TPA: VWA domain-containing protein, partial [Vicinamibacterales bacterium]|nr:VWA domain-containing protein [Vicinamibacterales bacterium]